MTDMIERVCKALIDADPTMDGYHHTHIDSKRRYARAAIAAMREPANQMLEDAGPMFPDGTDQDHIDWWQAMIDAALEEKPGD